MNSISRCKPLLGTYVNIDLFGDYSDGELLNISQKIFKRIEKIESLMSFHKADSELSCLNANAYYSPCSVSGEMKEILTTALKLSDLTNGTYDITIGSELVKNGFLPDRAIRTDNDASYKDIIIKNNRVKFNKRLQIDLGGIAKGYAVDQGLLEVKEANIHVIINAGGDLAMNDWEDKSINIRIPSSKNGQLANFRMMNKALATSASYYFDDNKSAIISPQTKKMLQDKRSVSVFAPSCMLADALTKVAFLYKNSASLLKSFDAHALFIDEYGTVS